MCTGKRPCEHEGRNQGAAPISQAIPKIASKPPEGRTKK